MVLFLTDVAIQNDINIKKTEHGGIENCKWLKDTLQKMCKEKATVGPVVNRALGAVTFLTGRVAPVEYRNNI